MDHIPTSRFEVVCDGSLLHRSQTGGWAAQVRDLSNASSKPMMKTGAGAADDSTEVEMRAMLLGLRSVPKGAHVRLLSDRQDLVGMLRDGRRHQGRLAGLMEQIVGECACRRVNPVWVRGHRGHPSHTACDRAALRAALRAASQLH